MQITYTTLRDIWEFRIFLIPKCPWRLLIRCVVNELVAWSDVVCSLNSSVVKTSAVVNTGRVVPCVVDLIFDSPSMRWSVFHKSLTKHAPLYLEQSEGLMPVIFFQAQCIAMKLFARDRQFKFSLLGNILFWTI